MSPLLRASAALLGAVGGASWEEPPASDDRPPTLARVRRFQRRAANARSPDAFCDLPRLDGRQIRAAGAAKLDAATRLGQPLLLEHLFEEFLEGGLRHTIRAHGGEAYPVNNGKFGAGRKQEVQLLGEYLSRNASHFHIFAVNSPNYKSPDNVPPHLHTQAFAVVLRALAPFFDDFVMRHIFSVGVQASAVGKHSHDESWLALLHGSKAWWIAEPNRAGEFKGWENPCAHLDNPVPPGIVFCVQRPGEIVYLGEHLDHATCNLEPFVLGVGAQGRIDMWPPLCQQAHVGDAAAVARLVEARADLGSATDKGETPMHRAATYGHMPTLEYLVSKRADVSARSNSESQPMHSAAQHGHVVAIEFLLRHRATLHAMDRGGLQPIHTATDAGHLSVVAWLIDQRAEVYASTVTGAQPLHAAAWGNLPLVELLVPLRGEVHVSDREGVQALHWASSNGSPEVISYLISLRADVQAKDKDGAQPLHWAAANGRQSLARVLISQGADVFATARSGAGALHWAAAHGQLPMAQFLVRRCADTNAQALNGALPRHFALASGHTSLVDFLKVEDRSANRSFCKSKIRRQQRMFKHENHFAPRPVETGLS